MVSLNRPAFLVALLAPAAPAFAGVSTAADTRFLGGGAPGWPIGASLGWTAAMLAALLLGGSLLVLSHRPVWRLGAIAIVGACALLGGDALLDGALTAIAVSP